jgi:tetraacyldisaccharide 4'-kinase
LVAYIALRLSEAGFTPIVLSRGYKGKLGSSPLLVSDGSRILSTPETCGDEPFLLARKLEGVVVAVDKNRRRAGQSLSDQPGNPVYILDDGFQHIKLARDLDLLLIDGTESLEDQALLPAGRLREPLSAMRRADAIVITREHLAPNLTKLAKDIRSWNPAIPIFPFSHEIDEIYDLGLEQRSHRVDLRGKEVVALAAIGNPTQFLRDIEMAGINVLERCLFRDHHRFSQKDLDRALKLCQARSATGIVTTEKDAVRLQGLRFKEGQVFAVSIKATAKEPASFLNWLLQRLKEK